MRSTLLTLALSFLALAPSGTSSLLAAEASYYGPGGQDPDTLPKSTLPPDFSAYYYPNGKTFDLGIRVHEDEKLVPRTFSHEELETFFGRLPQKELIEVIFHKNRLSRGEIETLAYEVRDYLFAVGFQRVVIRQARGGGTITIPKNGDD